MTHSATADSPSIDIRNLWQGGLGVLAQAMQPGAGFAFEYGGQPAGPEFSGEWQPIADDCGDVNLQSIRLEHASGLVVTREARRLPRFNAVEYQVVLKNTAKKALPSISRWQALNLSFGEVALHGNSVVASKGGLFDGTLPPDSFALRTKRFSPILDEWSAINTLVELATEGGRSSSKDLPFFFIHNEAKGEGLFVAFGWSGQWAARVWLNPDTKTVHVTGKTPGLEIALAPEEEIRGPSILVGFYQGTLSDGCNRLRRLINEVYTPKLAGQKMLPLAAYDTFTGGSIGVNFDEPLLRKLVDAAAALGQEYFLLDAGWVDDKTGGWGQGSWYEIDRTKFPQGLKPFADYVRSAGLHFGMWFDPETVRRGSPLAQEHPEWILWEYEKGSSAQEDFLARWAGTRGVLDHSLPEVQQWVCALLDHYIREYGVRYIRHDFNTAPLPYWDAKDTPNRRGMTQLRYIQGLYAVFDWIREHHPQVVLEGCASGGRRIDLEMARRCHTFWISDYTVDPAVVRFHLSGIHHFLPGNYSYVQYALPSNYQQDFTADDLGFQSLFAGAFGLGGRMDRWTPSMQQQARLHVKTWKRLRRYLVEDYYPLTAQARDLQSWSGWQFHDPADHSGFIQTFRTNTSEAKYRFVIHGLDDKARYRFTDAYSTEGFEMEGSVAMTTGIEVTQEPMSSRVLAYERR